MAEPELSCEQMEVQVGRLAMRVEHEIEGAAPLGAIRAAAASTIGAPRGINGRDARFLSGVLKEVVGFAQRGPIHLTLAATRTR